jgi:ribosomal protein S18 acetylase RimI-like enzyme
MTADRPPGNGRRVDGEAVLRPLGSEGDWRQSLLLRHTLDSEDHPLPAGHSQFIARSTAECRLLTDQGHAAYFGAFVDNRLCSVVGIVSDGQGVARFQNVGTHPACRNRGLASSLLARAGAFGLSDLGADRLVIVADRGGPATDLYRSLGFAPVEAQWGLSTSTVPGADGLL